MSGAERASKRRKLDFTDEFQVIVGNDGTTKKSYTVHKHVLVKSSAFFQKACDKPWKEGNTKVITLPEADCTYFDIYLELLYTGRVAVADDEDLTSLHERTPEALSRVGRINDEIIETYLLADMLLDNPCKNAIVDYFLQVAKIAEKVPRTDQVMHVFENTLPTIPFRRLLVDLVASKLDPDEFRDCGAEQSKEFFVEVAYRLMKTFDTKREFALEDLACAYHEHDEGCPKCS